MIGVVVKVSSPLEGKRVILREAEDKDLKQMYKWCEDDELQRWMGSFKHNDNRDFPDWYRQLYDSVDAKVFAIDTKDGRMIGDIELIHITWRNGAAELVVRIADRAFWGKGYGQDAINCILDYAYSDMKLKEIYLRVDSYNKRAIKCYKKCGFEKKGVMSIDRVGRGNKVYLMLNENKQKHQDTA